MILESFLSTTCWWLRWKLKVFYKRVLQRNKRVKQYYERKQMKWKEKKRNQQTNAEMNDFRSSIDKQIEISAETFHYKKLFANEFFDKRVNDVICWKDAKVFYSQFSKSERKKTTTTFCLLLYRENVTNRIEILNAVSSIVEEKKDSLLMWRSSCEWLRH